MPFAVQNSNNIQFSGFTIDYEYPLYIQGDIVNCGVNFIELKIDKNIYPYYIKERRFYYKTPYFETDEIGLFLEMDPIKKAPAAGVGDDGWLHNSVSTQLNEDVVRFEREFHSKHNVGNSIILVPTNRKWPGFFIEKSKNVSFNNITIHNTLTMAVVGQLSHNLSFDNFVLIPSNNRLISASADGLHFVNCTGDIIIKNSLFQNQKDDAVNCHGIYSEIFNIVDNSIYVKYKHFQHYYIDIYEVGDVVDIIDQKTLQKTGECTIAKVEIINGEVTKLTIKDLKGNIKINNAIELSNKMPNLYISNCKFLHNRARGMLITTNKHVEIKDNYFATAGTSILIEGDCNEWYESGPVKDINITNNIFDNCGYSPWGVAIIQSSPSVPKGSDIIYHKNIRLVGNRFINCKKPITYEHACDKFVMDNNIIE